MENPLGRWSFVADLNSRGANGKNGRFNDPQGNGQDGGRYSGSVSCGVGRKSRIVGGEQARPSEFPWQVGFRWETDNSRTNIFCGGSLIDKKWVVSAAHCFQRMQRPPNVLKVVLGEFDVRNEEGNEVVIAARKVIKKFMFCSGVGGTVATRIVKSDSSQAELLFIDST